MSMEYVRNFYRVPAKRGRLVTYNGSPGRITSADSRIRVLFDGEKHPLIIHPTDEGLVYLDASGEPLWPAHDARGGRS